MSVESGKLIVWDLINVGVVKRKEMPNVRSLALAVKCTLVLCVFAAEEQPSEKNKQYQLSCMYLPELNVLYDVLFFQRRKDLYK